METTYPALEPLLSGIGPELSPEMMIACLLARKSAGSATAIHIGSATKDKERERHRKYGPRSLPPGLDRFERAGKEDPAFSCRDRDPVATSLRRMRTWLHGRLRRRLRAAYPGDHRFSCCLDAVIQACRRYPISSPETGGFPFPPASRFAWRLRGSASGPLPKVLLRP